MYTKKFVFLVLLIGIIFFHIKLAHAVEVNLILNSTVEANNNNWNQDQWGDNTAEFRYEKVGHTSNKSLYVKVSNWKTGDAKWYYDPVNVKANTEYIFSDYYKSSVETSIVAMSLDGVGNPTYFDIATSQPASAINWKQASYSFRTLPNTKTLTIFHLVQKNGWLMTDDFNLHENLQVAPIIDNVPNNSLEVVSPNDSNFPDKWVQASWGTNTPIYEYSNDGYDGSRSVKLTMTNYTSGDAKWDYTPQTLATGKDYKFTAWYKTDTTPHVVVHYLKNNDTEDFFGLPDPEPTGTDWQQYSGVFSVPQNVKAVSVFFFLTNNGTVQTDDYHITPYQYVGFNRGIVTLTFDDGFENNVTTVLPVLAKYGFKTTHCFATMYVEGQPTQIESLKKISNDGHEICSHTVNHNNLSLEPIDAVDYELSHSQNFLKESTKQIVSTFTSPFGTYNTGVINEIKKYYNAHRTTNEGFNSKDNLDPYRLLVENMKTTTTLAQFKQWVNKAKANRTWLVLIYHVIDAPENGLEEFDTKKSDFDAQMKWLSTAGISIQRMDDALKETSNQVN